MSLKPITVGPKPRKKKTIADFQEMKKKGEEISYITAYTAPFAKCAEQAGIDLILIGDSVYTCEGGYPSTVHIPLDVDLMDGMILFSAFTYNGAPNTFRVGDMPYGSYQISVSEAIRNACRFSRQANVDAVKLEGGEKVIDKVRGIVKAGIGVMGHIGYTPQSSDIKRKSPKINGKTAEEAEQLIKDALALEEAEVFAVLLEAIPPEIGKIIDKACKIPVLGIGAGPHVDGQLLIIHDVLGLPSPINPKFAEEYVNLGEIITKAIKKYVADVKEGKFPDEKKHCYKMLPPESGKPGELEKLQKNLERPSSWLMNSGRRAEVNKAIEKVIKESKKA